MSHLKSYHHKKKVKKISKKSNLLQTTRTINFDSYANHVKNFEDQNLFDELKNYKVSTDLDRRLILGVFKDIQEGQS